MTDGFGLSREIHTALRTNHGRAPVDVEPFMEHGGCCKRLESHLIVLTAEASLRTLTPQMRHVILQAFVVLHGIQSHRVRRQFSEINVTEMYCRV